MFCSLFLIFRLQYFQVAASSCSPTRAYLWGETAQGETTSCEPGREHMTQHSSQPPEDSHCSCFNKMWHVASQPESLGAFFSLLYQKSSISSWLTTQGGVGDKLGFASRLLYFHASACIWTFALSSVLICISLKGSGWTVGTQIRSQIKMRVSYWEHVPFYISQNYFICDSNLWIISPSLLYSSRVCSMHFLATDLVLTEGSSCRLRSKPDLFFCWWRPLTVALIRHRAWNAVCELTGKMWFVELYIWVPGKFLSHTHIFLFFFF